VDACKEALGDGKNRRLIDEHPESMLKATQCKLCEVKTGQDAFSHACGKTRMFEVGSLERSDFAIIRASRCCGKSGLPGFGFGSVGLAHL